MESNDLALILSIIANFIGVMFMSFGKMYQIIQTTRKHNNLEIQKLRTIIDIFLNSKDFNEAKLLANLELKKIKRMEKDIDYKNHK